MIPLRIKTHYSIGLGYCKPEQVINRCKELGYSTAAITDNNSLSGSVEFNDALVKAGLKPIIGLEISTIENGGSLLLLAKNLNGWKELIKLSSLSNTDEFFKDNPRINFASLPKNGNLICITGYYGSYAANSILTEDVYKAETIEEVQSKLNITCQSESEEITQKLVEIFGKDNLFIGILLDGTPHSEILTQIYRRVAESTEVKTVALTDIYYVLEADYIDHYISLCSNLKIRLEDISKYDGWEKKFFKQGNQRYYMHSVEQMITLGYTQEEIDNTDFVGGLCETYKLGHPPRLPKYEWTEGMSEIDYLRHLCRNGWVKRYKDTWDKKVYGDRIKYELGVIEKNDLAGYFLIVQDFINYAKGEGWLVGPGRGSSGGSVVSYLTRIVELDPIKNKLSFERFYNEGRNSPGNVSLPDIDTDFPVTKRELVINYVRNRYGRERVSQMATFAKLQGRGALKEVLSRHNICDYETINTITECLPQKEEISDQLEDDQEDSIILWTLKYEPERVEQYCKYEDGKFTGEYAQYFAQAARIEGTIKSQGKHAAGIIISPVDLKDICPMIRDPSGNELITGLDMNNAKILGLTKMDILGVAVLDKLMGVNNLLRYGRINV